jgi:hypothetical protein
MLVNAARCPEGRELFIPSPKALNARKATDDAAMLKISHKPTVFLPHFHLRIENPPFRMNREIGLDINLLQQKSLPPKE